MNEVRFVCICISCCSNHGAIGFLDMEPTPAAIEHFNQTINNVYSMGCVPIVEDYKLD